MKLTGRRESTNVEDRRRMSGGTKAGMGIGGLLVVIILSFIMGGNPLSVLQQSGGLDALQEGDNQTTQRDFTPEEEELAKFSRQILAGTEDVWSKIFKQMGRTYKPPKMVLFTSSVQTGCGGATSEVGPFYCSADQSLYIDLSFFMQMKKQLGADGDFAYAYVIAHEVGHHVEYLLGTLSEAHTQMSKLNKTQANRISVRIELLADFYAGIWAYHDNRMFGSLEDGDIEEALNCAKVIGDNYLQEKARGYSQPETFTHGTSKQRMKWLKLGLNTGDISKGNVFELSDSEL